MNVMNTVLPFTSSIISFIFAFLILKRYTARRGPHLLLWGIGMIFYGIGGFCEGYYGAFGWNDLIFRMWYLFGAILVAAWLGQGTVYLLAKRNWANGLMVVLALGSLYGLIRVFGAELNPTLMTTSLHTGSEMSGHAIITPGVRTLTPFFNMYGVILLVGGAIYSAYYFWKTRSAANRMIGNILIAAGAMMPAFGGSAQRFGIPVALYVGEFLGAVLMFIGYLYTSRPARTVVSL